MKTCLLFAIVSLGIAPLGTAATSAGAPGKSSRTIAFADPSKPGKLEIELGSQLFGAGVLTIRGGDAPDVTVSAAPQAEAAVREDGLRVLSSSSQFNLSQQDNVVRLDYPNRARTVRTLSVAGKASVTLFERANGEHPENLEIVVPRNTAITISGSYGPDSQIEIADIAGDVEIRTNAGDIVLNNLGGGALVETINGRVDASFAALPGKPVSITSMRGEVEMRVPANGKAAVRLRTYTGEILTDFDEAALVSKLENTPPGENPMALSWGTYVSGSKVVQLDIHRAVPKAADSGAPVSGSPGRLKIQIPPMTGGKLVTGELNGGGAEISIATMNGDVILRKRSP